MDNDLPPDPNEPNTPDPTAIEPSAIEPAEPGAQSERAFGEAPGADILAGGARPKAGPSRSVAFAVILAVVLAAGGAVVAVRAFTGGAPNLDALVPADSAAYVKASIHPSVDQQQAIRKIVDRFPGARASFASAESDTLNKLLAKAGISYDEVKRWVGDQIAIAVSIPSATATQPDVVGLIDVTDANAARASLQKLSSKSPGSGAFEIDGGVAYLGNTKASLAAFRDRAKSAPLSDVAAFKSAHASVGGDGLVLAYVDSAKLGSFASAIPGVTAQNGGGTGAYALRAESQGFVIQGHQTSSAKGKPTAGRPVLVEQSSSNMLAAITLFDVGGILARIGTAGGALPVPYLQGLNGVLRNSGLNLADLEAWTHGEFSILVGGLTPAPTAAILIRPTDKAALARTLASVRAAFGRALAPKPGGFDFATPQGFTLAVRTAADRVVIASGDAYATQLLTAAPDKLANDAVYTRVLGGSQDHVSFQMFVRLDRVRALAEAFIHGAQADKYNRDVKPWLSAFETLSMRATSLPGESNFRMVLSVTP